MCIEFQQIDFFISINIFEHVNLAWSWRLGSWATHPHARGCLVVFGCVQVCRCECECVSVDVFVRVLGEVYLENIVSARRELFPNKEGAKAHALWPQGKSELCVYRELPERVIVVIVTLFFAISLLPKTHLHHFYADVVLVNMLLSLSQIFH